MNTIIDVVCYRSKTLSNGELPLMLRLTKEGKRKYLSLQISLNPDYWDFNKNRPRRNCPEKDSINFRIQASDFYFSDIDICWNSMQECRETVLPRFPINKHMDSMKNLNNIFMDVHQFAQFLGKGRLYQGLSPKHKMDLPEMLMTDTQMNQVARAYYQDKDFGVDPDFPSKSISMWKVYNLLTQANKLS